MKKFKPGDVVKVISTGCASCGNVGIVKKITDNKTWPYTVMFLDAESEYSEDELEKVCDGKSGNGEESRKTIPVNTSKKMVQDARAKALKIAPLRKALKDWFDHKGYCPNPEITDFKEWVEKLADDLARDIHEDKNVTVENLVTALKVQAMGDVNAIRFSNRAAKEGWQTDINCYIEEGIVYASVWLHGNDPKATEKKADAIAEKFRKLGYAASVWVDEEDEHDVTVNACLDFPLYVELVKKGGRHSPVAGGQGDS